MNFLHRKVRPEETASAEIQRIFHRETEITVEREWISVAHTPHLLGSQPGSAAEPEILPPALPPPTRID